MKPNELFEVIKAMEKDLASFYERLGNVSQLADFVEIFNLMSDHSSGHSKSIANSYQSIKVPDLNIDAVFKIHNNIKKSLFDKVTSERNVKNALSLLADSEELIGKVYASIAENYEKTAKAYQSASDQLKQLADEEIKHRDFILNRIETS